MVHFAPFLYFEFRPDSADTADTDRVGPIWAALALISAASARFKNSHVARRGTDARSAASLPRCRVLPRRTPVRWPGSRVRASQIKPIEMSLVTLSHFSSLILSSSLHKELECNLITLLIF